ncbi:hypothetical protein, partial [Bacillus sp. V5-8f]|uniref:hypothetical protein n=1 Tax=Bacillus sp. V5-8f TaxID=2053044 RepID=UPI000CB59754
EDGTNWGGHHFEIYGDGELIATYDLKVADLPANVDLQIENITKLEVVFSGQIDNGVMNFANVIIK